MAHHVDIVEVVENVLVYTMEGNNGDICAERHYTFESAPIYDYCLPLYLKADNPFHGETDYLYRL